METLNHFLGLCGEHWHPNAFTIIFLLIVLKFIYEKKVQRN